MAEHLASPLAEPKRLATPYSVAELGRILFTANRLSQGRSNMVDRLLEYAAANITWTPEIVNVDEVCSAVRGRVLTFVRQRRVHGYIDTESVDAALEQQVAYFRSHLGPDSQASLFSHNAIGRGMVELDHHYTVMNPQGRPRTPQPEGPTTDFHDAWLSHVCHFCINGHSTKHPLFDGLMSELQPLITGGLETRTKVLSTFGVHQLQEVVRVHNRHHPNEYIELPE